MVKPLPGAVSLVLDISENGQLCTETYWAVMSCIQLKHRTHFSSLVLTFCRNILYRFLTVLSCMHELNITLGNGLKLELCKI
jgi:hypothetical protein